MTQTLHDFLYTIGLYPWDYPLVSKLETEFIDGERKEITDQFIPYENLLKEDSMNEITSFLNSAEEKLQRGENFKIDRIQIATYAVTINPFTDKLQLFMRDV